MRRRSRIRRILKWTALVLCVGIVLVTVLTLDFTCANKDAQVILGVGRGTVFVCWNTGGGVLRETVFVAPWSPLWEFGTPCSAVAVPLWIPIGLTLILTASLWWRDRAPPPGRCRRCGYDLTGNVSGKCPERGTEVPAMQLPITAPPDAE